MVISLALLGSCRCEDNGAELGTAVPAPKPVPERPPGLLGELVVAEPATFWSQAQSLAGIHARTLPVNPELLLTSMLELPALSAGSFDLKSPIVGVLLDRPPASPGLVLAVHLTSGRELVAQLTSGAAPPFRRETLEHGYSVLEPADGSSGYPLSVFRNHLIVSSDRRVDPKIARFLVEVLAAQSAPSGQLTVTSKGAELKGPVSKLLQAQWAKYRTELIRLEREARAQQAGRQPDFGEPAGVHAALGSGVDAVLELLHSTRQLRVTVAPGATFWSVLLELEPEPSGTAHDLVTGQITGSTAPLKRLPAGAAIAVLTRSSAQQRRQGARETLGQLVQVLGSRLDEPSRARLSRVVENLAAGRGDSMQAALVLGKSPGIVIQGRVAEADKLRVAFKELPQLLRSRAFSDPLSHWLGPLSTLAPPQHPFDGALVLAFGAGGRLGRFAPSGLASFWRVSDAEYHLSLSAPPGRALLRSSLKPESTLADLPSVMKALERVEAASLVVVIRPELLGLVPAETRLVSEGIVLLHTGRQERSGHLRVELPVSLLQASLAAAVQP